MATNLDLSKLLPQTLQNPTSVSLIQNLYNRFLSTDESTPVLGWVNNNNKKDLELPQPNYERKLNALTPMLWTQHGAEKYVTSFDDIVQKLNLLGTDVDAMHEWCRSPSFNFAPPIDFDKFTNFSRYRWVAKSIPHATTRTYNEKLEHQYYVIGWPVKSALWKKPARVASVSNVSIPAGLLTVDGVSLKNGDRVILKDQIDPKTNGVYNVQAYSETSPPAVYFVGGTLQGNPGDHVAGTTKAIVVNGRITDIVHPSNAGFGYATPPTVQFAPSSATGAAAEVILGSNGEIQDIIITNGGAQWARSEDFDDENLSYDIDGNTVKEVVTGSYFYVTEGTVNANKSFTMSSDVVDVGTDDFIFTPAQQVSDWTADNYWVHENDIARLGIDINVTTQALRPIIEYSFQVEMNDSISDGQPCAPLPTPNAVQVKTRFNQLPLFNLYRLDTAKGDDANKVGVHSGLVSSLMYYDEDPNFPIDAVIKKRIAGPGTVGIDYTFSQALNDASGKNLFYKKDQVCQSIWVPGAIEGPQWTVEGSDAKPITLPAGPVGSRQEMVYAAAATPTRTVATTNVNIQPYGLNPLDDVMIADGDIVLLMDQTDDVENGLYFVSATAWSKVSGYSSGKFVKVIDGTTRISSVWVLSSDDYTAGQQWSQTKNTDCAWSVPPQMFYNTKHENRKSSRYGDLKVHFASILLEQPGFKGSQYGANNTRDMDINAGLGGKIKDYGGSFNLYLGMMNQEDLSITSILNFAEQAYAIAFNSAVEFLNDNISQLIGDGVIGAIDSINPTDDNILKLLLAYEESNTFRSDLTKIFGDSTSAIKNWPATLPYLGMARLVKPNIQLDPELGLNVLVHHDGHRSAAYVSDDDAAQRLARTSVLRSDGTYTTGSFSVNVPTNPYKNQLWYNIDGSGVLKVFDVLSDTDIFAEDIGNVAARNAKAEYVLINPDVSESDLHSIGTNAKYAAMSQAQMDLLHGDLWFKRSTGHLFSWDSTTGSWIDEGFGKEVVNTAYKVLDLNDLYNSYMLALELELYHQAPPVPLSVDVNAYVDDEYRGLELAKFASKYGFDTYAPDFNVTDAFTWNYKQSTFAGSVATVIGATPMIPRWYDIYRAFFSSAMYPDGTCRPNLEPWVITQETEQSFRLQWPSASFGSAQMWNYVKTKWVGKPLCVDTATNTLLPPYVSASDARSAEALLKDLPPGISAGYELGDNGPVELAWTKSNEYLYGMLNVIFRRDPLAFITDTWGNVITHVGSYEINRIDGKPQDVLTMPLHGELNDYVRDTTTLFSVEPVSGYGAPANWILTCIAAYSQGAIFSMTSDIAVNLPNVEVGVRLNSVTAPPWLSFELDDDGISYRIGDKIMLSGNSQGVVTYTFMSSSVMKYAGVAQLYSNALRYGAIDTVTSLSVDLMKNWKMRLGYRVGGLLNTESLKLKSDNYAIHTTDYDRVIKRNKFASGTWLEALRIQLVQIGASEFVNGVIVPAGIGADWKFRVEVYNPRNPQLDYFELDTSAEAEFTTFKALGSAHTDQEWKLYENTTQRKKMTVPTVITGIQNIVNLINGYVVRLHDDNWVFSNLTEPNVDADTGRTLDWQLETEKFIDAVYSGMRIGQGFVMAPHAKNAWIKTPFGITAEFAGNTFTDTSLSSCVLDVNGLVIQNNSYRVLRTDQLTSIASDVPMMSVRAMLESYEHVLVFNDYSSDDSSITLIYDPYLGLKVPRIFIDGTQEAEFDGKPSFGGHYTVNGESRNNIESSIAGMTDYYRVNSAAATSRTGTSAQTLLGYNPKSYFDDIDAPATSQFNFWRGLIHNKGSNSSIDAYLNSAKFKSAKLDEFWAYKLATYGDARPRNYPELKISSDDAKHRFTVLRFMEDGEIPPAADTSIINVAPDDDQRWYTVDDIGTHLYFEMKVNEILSGTGAEGDIIDLSIPSELVVGAERINATTVRLRASDIDGGTYTITSYGPWAPKFSPAKLINYAAGVVNDDIAIWDPARNRHSVDALSIVNTVDTKDPACYNTSTQIVENSNYDPLRSWNQQHVGYTWWNTNNLDYIPYYDDMIFPEQDGRLNRWGSLADWSSVELYEWVKSPVPPSEYSKLVEAQEGNADIPNDEKASGKAAAPQTFLRDRVWKQRPVAWKYSAYPPGGHNFVAGSGQQRIMISGNGVGEQLAVLNVDRFSSFDIESGMQIAAFDYIAAEVPLGLGTFTGTVYTVVGKEEPVDWSDDLLTEFASKFEYIKAAPGTNAGRVIGPVVLSNTTNGTDGWVKATALLTGITQTIKAPSAVIGDLVLFDFTDLGVAVSGRAKEAATSAEVAAQIGDSTYDIYIREAKSFDIVIPFPPETVDNSNLGMSNDPDDNLRYGFAVWNTPTADDLSNDLASPTNSWLPIAGDWVDVEFNPTLLARIKADDSDPIILPTGARVDQFMFTWKPWVKMVDARVDSKLKTLDTTLDLTFDASVDVDGTTGNLPLNQLRVYVNGSVRQPSEYSVLGRTVTFFGKMKLGDMITAIVRKYEPSAEELAFDPTSKDNLAITRQYKVDYEYVTYSLRDSEGNTSSSVYYFWVKDKAYAAKGKTLALKNAADMLRKNEDPFMVLQEPREATSALPARFAIAGVYGLFRQVTKDATYKLRFTRDFALRDDPAGIDLKNVHTEWIILRPSQPSRIPQELWTKMVDSLCAEDASGNRIPSLNRVDYDNRNNTKTRYGFGPDQTFVDSAIGVATVQYTILNTKLRVEIPGTSVEVPDYIETLDFRASDAWFTNSATTRYTLTKIWNEAKPTQVNEIFFAVLQDALACNYELTDMFKTSMLSAYSIRVVDHVES